MVEWGVSDQGVHATGRSGSVAIQMRGWTPTRPASRLPLPVDVALAGRTESIRIPTSDATITVGGATRPLTPGRLDAGDYLLSAPGPVETLVRFRGPAVVESDGSGLCISFPADHPLSLGFQDQQTDPETVAVPRTPAGIASAVTLAGEPLADRGPERSRPSMRPHPPLFTFDDAADVPIPSTSRNLVFRVPDDLEHVLVAAPLAYYLGAELVVESRTTPLLTGTTIGFERVYGSLPTFASEVAADCRRVFYLDCLAREQTPNTPLDRTPLVQLGLSATDLQSVSPTVRYATYLDAPVGPTDLPPWHLSTYVEATYERARALPHLLDQLSLVYPAEASEMEPRELLERSLDDFFRGEVVSVSPVAPDLGAGNAHAWLADGEPVDAFKTTPEAYDHRLDAAIQRPETLSIAVVLNDAEMESELAVADIYRARASSLPLSVTVHESLTRAELAAVLERETDFVHYVGHCEVDGLRCTDGYLSTSSLDRSGATTFFLNACGSYHEGETLVEKGSVAGGVTLDKVLNEQAARVGTAFGRLVVGGFGIGRALSVARRRIMMGRDYAVVGEGSFALTPACGDPALVTVDTVPEGYEVQYAVESTRAAGASYVDPFEGTTRLYGEPSRATLDGTELERLLESRSVPVVFDGDLLLSDEFGTILEGTDAVQSS